MVRLVVRQLLKKKGISVRKFAKMIKSDYPSMFRALKPTANPTLRTMEKWAKALDVKIFDLFQE